MACKYAFVRVCASVSACMCMYVCQCERAIERKYVLRGNAERYFHLLELDLSGGGSCCSFASTPTDKHLPQ